MSWERWEMTESTSHEKTLGSDINVRIGLYSLRKKFKDWKFLFSPSIFHESVVNDCAGKSILLDLSEFSLG